MINSTELEKIKSMLIKKETIKSEGSSLNVENTAEGLNARMLKIVNDKLEQENVPSLDYPSDVTYLNGNVDFIIANKNKINVEKINSGNYYNANGQITTSVNWGLIDVKVNKNEQYYLSGNNVQNIVAHIVLLDKNKNLIKVVGSYMETHLIQTTEDTAYVGISVPNYADGTASDVSTIMLEKGSKATDYETYKEKIYPIDFKRRNLFKIEDTKISNFGVTCSVKNQKITLKGTASGISTNQTMLISFPITLKKGTYRFNTTEFDKKYFTLRKNNLTWIRDLFNTTGSASNPVLTIEDDDTYKIGLHIINGVTYDDELSLQISEGTEELSVVPYSEEEYEYSLIGENDKVVYLSDAEAAELGLTDGKGWYVYNEWGKYVFDGSENIVKTSETSSNIFYASNIIDKAIGDYCDGFCNYASNAKAYPTNIDTFAIRNSGASVFFNSELSTVEEFKAKLEELYESGNPLYVVYQLAESKYKKITTEILIKQLDKFLLLKEYNDVTNFDFDQDVTFEIEVEKDNIKIINSRLNELEKSNLTTSALALEMEE